MQKKSIQMKKKLFKKTLLFKSRSQEIQETPDTGVWLATQEMNSHSFEVEEVQIEN